MIITAKISKWGNSLGVRLPKKIINEAQLCENERVELIVDKMSIKIKKINQAETLDDLFKNACGRYTYHEIDTDGPVGNEVE